MNNFKNNFIQDTNPKTRSSKYSEYSSKSKTPTRTRSPETPPRRFRKPANSPESSNAHNDFPSRSSTKTPSIPLQRRKSVYCDEFDQPPRRSEPPRRKPFFQNSYTEHPRRKSAYQGPFNSSPRRKTFIRDTSKTPTTSGYSRSFQKNETLVKGPKYIVENIAKEIEDSVLYDHFKLFGEVHKVTVREKGVDKDKVDMCTAFLQFCDEPKEGFLEAEHNLNNSILKVRDFFDGKDTEKLIDDWGSDELNDLSAKREQSRSPSPPRKFQRSESRSRSEMRGRSKSIYSSQYESRNRSPSGTSAHQTPKGS